MTKQTQFPVTLNSSAWLVGVLALAALVRLYGLGTEDYWLDELHSMADSAGRRDELEAVPYGTIIRHAGRPTDLDAGSSLASVWRTMRYDSHPPFYFLLLYGWRRVWGDSESVVRTLPVIFSVLSIVPVVLILREPQASACADPRGLKPAARFGNLSGFQITGASPPTSGGSAGLWAGLVLALAFTHIWMGQENRPYSLSMLLICCSYSLLVRGESCWSGSSLRKKLLTAVLYGVSVYLALLTHYFTGPAVLAQGLYALLRFRGPVLHWWMGTLVIAVGAVVATWGPTFLSQLDFIRDQPWLLEQTSDHAWRTFLRFCDLPARFLIHCQPFRTNLLQSALGVGLFLGSAILAWRRSARYALLFALWFAVPAGALALLDWTTNKQLLTHLRYSSIAVPGIVGLLALALGELRVGLRTIVLLALTATMLWRLELPAADNPDARGAATRLQAMAQAQDLVIYDAVGGPRVWVSLLFVPMSYYLPGFNCPVVLLCDPPDPGLLEQIRSYPRIIVVSPRIDAIPHPSPATHELVARTDYIRKIGWIYEFVSTGP